MADSIQSKFAEAWGEVKNPDLDSVNPHFKNRYASLKATLKAVRAVCAPRGLVYKQALKHHDWGYMLHSSVEDGEGGCIDLSEFPSQRPVVRLRPHLPQAPAGAGRLGDNGR